MIYYGILVKSEALGSTDGFHVVQTTFFAYAPVAGEEANLALYIFTAAIVAVAGLFVAKYLSSTMGHLTTAIRDNEIRVEYLGFSVHRAIHFKFTLAGMLAGAGGALVAIAVGHVDPEMVYWIASGEFVFVTILSGTGNVIAPFIGSIVFELLRSFALEYAPYIWQIIVGGSLLLVIIFLPGGLWSLIERKRGAEA
jgi:branched-chain amino acid transport system permease protein